MLSGREYVEAIVDGREPQPPMLETLSIRIIEVADGHVVHEGSPAYGTSTLMMTLPSKA